MQEIKSVNEFNEVIENDKVLVDFYADWCGPCKMLETVLEQCENELSDYLIVRVNTDRLMQLTRKYRITSIPALKVFSKGKVIMEENGFKTRDELLKTFKGD